MMRVSDSQSVLGLFVMDISLTFLDRVNTSRSVQRPLCKIVAKCERFNMITKFRRWKYLVKLFENFSVTEKHYDFLYIPTNKILNEKFLYLKI